MGRWKRASALSQSQSEANERRAKKTERLLWNWIDDVVVDDDYEQMLYSVLRDFSFIPLLTLFISIYVSKTKRNSAGFQFSHPEAAKLSFSSCRQQRCCCFHRTFFPHIISYHSHFTYEMNGFIKSNKKRQQQQPLKY